jgi:hypothetical protein
MPKDISYSNGAVVPSVIVIWEDHSHERRGNWYRAFWADAATQSTGSPVVGYCDSGPDGQWGTYRTIKACAAATRRMYPGEPIYRNGKEVAP